MQHVLSTVPSPKQRHMEGNIQIFAVAWQRILNGNVLTIVYLPLK